MQLDKIFDCLEPTTHAWVLTMSEQDIANILTAVHQVPGVILALKKNVKVSGSAEIGKVGEDDFEKICKKLPINYTLRNTAKTGHAGDFIISYSRNGKSYTCLVDTKLYKSTVPGKEITKFQKDLTYGNYDAGLMLSYKSKFVGISEKIHMDELSLPNGTIPVMFLSQLSTDIICDCIEMLFMRVSHTKPSISIDVENTIKYINQALTQTANTRRLLGDIQRTTNNTVQSCLEQLLSCEIHIKHAIDLLKPRDNEINENVEGGFAPVDSASSTNDLDLSKFAKNDHPIINRLLTEFKWTIINNNILSNDSIAIELKPMKSKTKVVIPFNSTPEDCKLGVFSLNLGRAKTMTGILNDSFIEELKKYYVCNSMQQWMSVS